MQCYLDETSTSSDYYSESIRMLLTGCYSTTIIRLMSRVWYPLLMLGTYATYVSVLAFLVFLPTVSMNRFKHFMSEPNTVSPL